MADKFTAVVYFHGIGQQSRYEELSRLLESFDDYAAIQNDTGLGQLEVHVEPSRSPYSENNIGFVSLDYNESAYRFYEVYWAPLTATGTTGWQVFAWFMRHIGTPFNILRSRWHSRQRLRRSYLYMFWQEKYNDDPNITPLRQLLDYYEDYCDKALRGSSLKGTYEEFVDYLRQKNVDDALLKLTKNWHDYMQAKEVWNFFVFLTMGYLIIIVPLLTVWRSLDYIVRAGLLADLMPQTPFEVTLYVLVLALLLYLPMLIGKYLKDYGGDVQLWATYEETSDKHEKHEEILKRGITALTHVLNHKDCERVLIVAHSLGTTIAYDTLLAIGRHNRAYIEALTNDEPLPKKLKPQAQDFAPLPALNSDAGSGGGFPSPVELGTSEQSDLIQTDTIQYFVTMGSPVDKIHYFFESRRGKYRPYELIVDNIRGDMGQEPFTDSTGKPNFRWVNFWQQEDYISGALFTPFHRKLVNSSVKIHNVLVQSYLYPSFGSSHVGYFRHNDVIGFLYEIIFRTQAEHDEPTKLLRETLKEKQSSRSQRIRDWSLVALWALPFAVFFDVVNIPILFWIFSAIFVGTLGFLGVLAVLSVVRGMLHPFKKNE